MNDASMTINDFLTAAAAKQPTPGGGSVAALAGALAAFEPELRASLAEFTRARMLLLQLMIEDQAAYESLTAAKKLPETSAERAGEFAVALLASIRVPQVMGATALAILDLCDKLVDKVNHFLLSDLAVCCELAMATVRCASYNVRANLPDVSDADDRAKIDAEAGQLVAHATAVIRQVIPRIWARYGKSA